MASAQLLATMANFNEALTFWCAFGLFVIKSRLCCLYQLFGTCHLKKNKNILLHCTASLQTRMYFQICFWLTVTRVHTSPNICGPLSSLVSYRKRDKCGDCAGRKARTQASIPRITTEYIYTLAHTYAHLNIAPRSRPAERKVTLHHVEHRQKLKEPGSDTQACTRVWNKGSWEGLFEVFLAPHELHLKWR